MKVEVDQSIKIEQTSKDTIIAFSNDTNYSIVIPSKVKQHLKKEFRRLSMPHFFLYRTFAAGVVLLIKGHLRKIDVLIIDREYAGREKTIENAILEMLKRMRRKQPQIYFKEIGHSARAHNIAYAVMKKKRKPDRTVRLYEVKELALPKTKSRGTYATRNGYRR